MKNWTIVVFLFWSMYLFSQPKDAVIEEKDGKKYYIHIVQSGNSLWGIHVLYNVPVDDIITVNPGVENGIKDGQKLFIPVMKTHASKHSEVITSSNSELKHIVQPQETLFGISKKYNIPKDQIIAANPGSENGVKIGQELIIPILAGSIQNPITTNKQNTTKIVFSDTIINHVVLDHETMYSISKRFMVPVEDIQVVNGLKNNKIKPGDVIKVPIKKEKVQKIEVREVKQLETRKTDSTLLFKIKDQYSIAILLPFFLDKSNGYSENVSNLATEFYMGAQLAIDSLENLGLNAKFYVYDTQNDSNLIKDILKKPEFTSIDMIIGPLFPDKMNIVAKWCKENKVKLICPVASNSEILKANPYVYAAIPSDATLMEGAAKYVMNRNQKDQIVLVKPVNEKDLILYDRFRTAFLTTKYDGVRQKLIEATLSDFKTYLKKGLNTTLIIPSTDETTSTKFMNTLIASATSQVGTITVFGTKEWLVFEDMNSTYKNKFNFHFSSPNDFNYNYQATKELTKKYRKTYNADMTKMAVQGFDVLHFFCSKYLLNQNPTVGIMSNFNMIQKGLGNGFENNNSFILSQQDFEIIKISETNE